MGALNKSIRVEVVITSQGGTTWSRCCNLLEDWGAAGHAIHEIGSLALCAGLRLMRTNSVAQPILAARL
jgi:hypothetical protein